MANQPMRVPWMHSLILTTANTVYNLYTLVAAITPSINIFAKSVKIQLDIGAGAAKCYIGSPDSLATNDCGQALVATQIFDTSAFTSDACKLPDIALMADTNSTQVNVTIFVQ